MRIPKNTLRNRHLVQYGVQGMEMPGVTVQYAGCPARYKAQYQEFTVKEPDSPVFEYGNVIHDALFLAEEEGLPLLPDALDKAWSRTRLPLGPEHYAEAVSDLTAFLDRGGLNLSTLAVEQELVMPLCEHRGEEWFFGGRLDWIGMDPNDPYTLYLADYKTNRAPPKQEDLDRDSQFTGYGLLLRANIEKYAPDVDPAEVKIVGIMEAVKWYQLLTTREEWQYEAYHDWLRAMLRRIVDDEAGDPVLNENCGSCPIKYDCKEFRKLPGKGETLADRMSRTTDLTQRVLMMQQAQLTQRAMKALIEEVQAELLKDRESAGEPVVINGVQYEAVEAWENVIDTKEIWEALGTDRFLSIAGVTQKSLEPLMKQDPELKSRIQAAMKRLPKPEKRLAAKKAD